MNIFIAAHYNLNNGDKALLEATIQLVKAHFGSCNITVSAYLPKALSDSRFMTVGWPLGNGVKEKIFLWLGKYSIIRSLYKRFCIKISDKEYIDALLNANIVLISGGHHLTDILGIMTYYKLASNFIAPIKLKKKIFLLPQSIGPAKNIEVQKSIKYILNSVKSIAYRDESSKKFLDDLASDLCTKYVPDLVYSLKVDKYSLPGKSKEVGIALYHSYTGDRKKNILPYTISGLSKVIDDLICRGYRVKIIPMDIGDESYADIIYNKMLNPNKKEMFFVAKSSHNILELICEFQGLSFVLAYKTHATIFSMICNTPLVAIAYHQKTIEFMDSIGLKEFTVYDTSASYEKIIKIINEIEINTLLIKEKEKIGVDKNRKLIINYLMEINFDEVD